MIGREIGVATESVGERRVGGSTRYYPMWLNLFELPHENSFTCASYVSFLKCYCFDSREDRDPSGFRGEESDVNGSLASKCVSLF